MKQPLATLAAVALIVGAPAAFVKGASVQQGQVAAPTAPPNAQGS